MVLPGPRGSFIARGAAPWSMKSGNVELTLDRQLGGSAIWANEV